MGKLIYLEWESNFFNKKVFLLENFKENNFQDKIKYDLIEANVNLNEKEKIKFLEKNRFEFQELSIKFRKKIKGNFDINFE